MAILVKPEIVQINMYTMCEAGLVSRLLVWNELCICSFVITVL